MKANRSPLMISSGIFWPSWALSFGFGSKRSTCDGPPAMNRKMMFLAFGAKCGGRAVSGSAATDLGPKSSGSRRARRASPPMPNPPC